MPTLTERITRAQEFIWINARLLERRRFAYHFAGGPRSAVLGALRPYQNDDGGFGNALEPDKRCPESQPIDVEIALRTLDAVDGLADPMVARACDWLMSITTDEGGVPFALPSIRSYPRAPWWDAEENPPASLNPTASIAGLLLKHGISHPWVDHASSYCWKAIASLGETEYHTLMPAMLFLAYTPDRERAEAELERLLSIIAGPGVVALDPNAEGYVHKPLDWAPQPTSPCRRIFNDELLTRHLAALAERQQEDGGWPLSWQPIGPGVACEFRGYATIEALRTLRAYAEAGFTV